jgi:anti-sigma B factor antagonist
MEFVTDETPEGVTVIRSNGRLNMASAPTFRAVVTECTDAGRSRIVVDLSGVSFIDSSGLGALIGGLKTTRQADGDLRIAAPNEQVATVLGLTNLDRVLRPFATVADAISGW